MMMEEADEKRPLFTPPPPEYPDDEKEEKARSYVKKKRSKTGSRVYYTVLLFLMFLLVLLAGISLGSFGYKQSKITSFYGDGEGSDGHCVLYVTNDNSKFNFPKNYGPCAFVFWGLASLAIVAFSFNIYFIVLIAAGPKVLSCFRLLELLVSVVTFLGGFVLSITITAGLKKTCGAVTAHSKKDSCSDSPLSTKLDSSDKIYFYSEILVAQNTCWVITLLWFLLSIWKLVVVIVYMKQRKRRTRNEQVI